jgi:ATP-dependent helicase/DNAse subunit B
VFGERKGELAAHRTAMRALAEQHFAELRESYPFANELVAQAQLKSLCDQLEKLLDYDWNEGRPRAFVGVEQAFGYDEPCVIDTPAGALYVRGSIDRLDTESKTLLIRDLKTGKGKPRKGDAAPKLAPDLQLGLYGRVAEAFASTWKVQGNVAVSYVYLRSGDLERRWEGTDYRRLQEATGEWLAAGIETLTSGAYVRSTDPGDCTYCAFKAVCAGDSEHAEAAMQHRSVPKRLRVLKQGEE